jgi:ZIP family zinc transporter/zinc and cadmium transporter
MDERFWVCLLGSLLAAVFTTLGISVIRSFQEWGEKYNLYFVCFASGVLISASFLHLIPKSLAMNTLAAVYLLLGYWGLHLFNYFLTAYVCDQNELPSKPSGIVALVAIGFHSFIDGIVYSVTYTVGVFTGILATTGMICHEFPEGIITYLLLIRAGYNRQNAFVIAFLVAALSTPLGMLVSYPFIAALSPPVLGALLALSAGGLIYAGATHLLPQAEREPAKYSLVALACGILVAAMIVLAGA